MTSTQTQTQTQMVRVSYQLSAAGQRAALLQGRPAQSGTITEDLPIATEHLADIIDRLTINSQGIPTLQLCLSFGWLTLDEPPTITSALAALDAARREREAQASAEEARRAQEKAELEAQRLADAPLVQEILAAAELAPYDQHVAGVDFFIRAITVDGRSLALTDAARNQLTAIRERRDAEREAAKQAAAKAKEDAKAAIVAEHGGYHWPAGPQCDFLGYGIWNANQDRRWVGIFTEMRGVSGFLNSPRGEHVFDISGLRPGDCIQCAGFDVNSRGKRRNESEWFGLVIANDDRGLVVREQPTRAAALAASRKIK